MQTNPYQILGVSETDSIENIEYVYKQFVKLLHPDKSHTKEAKNLNLNHDEKAEYLLMITNAYKTIMSTKKTSNYPDYKINYEIKEDSRIYYDNNIGDLTGTNDFQNKFNRQFDASLERDKKAGMVDAYGKGYKEFDAGKKYSDDTKLSIPSYSSDVDVSSSKNFYKPNNNDNRLINYLPEANLIGSFGAEYQELGLINITDFSMTTSGKGGLGGTDLMSAYAHNYEPWENTFKKSKEYSKFDTNDKITDKVTKMEQERGRIYDLPLDQNMIKAEKTRNFALEQQEKLRMNNLNKRDEYYNEINKGRIKDKADYDYLNKLLHHMKI